MVIGLYLLAAWQGSLPGLQGASWYLYWDTDSYSRMLRVLQLRETGAWYDTHAAYYNAPHGMQMHWSRSLDVLLYAGAWAGSHFTDFRTSLEIWATLLCGPILYMLFVPVLYWAVREHVGSGWFLLAVLMLLSQASLGALFRPGFIDYHGLVVLLQFSVIALLLRRLATGGGPHASVAGVLAGFGVWTTVEGLLVLAIPAVIVLTLLWVWERGDWLDELAHFGFAFGATLAAALVLERPPADGLSVEYDRISALHLFVAGVLSLAVWALQWLDDVIDLRTSRSRVLVGGMVAAFGLTGLLGLFPGLGGHPQGALSEIVEVALDTQISEIPYLSRANLTWSMALRELGPLLFVVPYAVVVAVAGTRDQRRRLVLYGTFLAIMVAYAMLRGRALPFVQLCLLLPWLEAVRALWLRMSRALANRAAPALLAAGSVLAITFAHLLPQTARSALAAPSAARPPAVSCLDERIYSHLKTLPDYRPGMVFLSSKWDAPALVYRAGVSTISSPYHRNTQGIEDGFVLLWMEPEYPGIRDLAEARRVDYVFVCKSYLHSRRKVIAEAPEVLVARLARDDPPPWLKKVAMPGDLDKVMLLYRAGFGAGALRADEQ